MGRRFPALQSHAPVPALALTLGLMLGEAGVGPLAHVQGRSEPGHPVERRLLPGAQPDSAVPQGRR